MLQHLKKKGKLKQDKYGRYHIRFKDQHSKRIYHIEAPNNVFFNDELALSMSKTKKRAAPLSRGRQLVPPQLPFNQNEVSDYSHRKPPSYIVPVVKRNLTPDDHLSKVGPEGYLLVDGKGKPRKIYIQRKNNASQIPSEERQTTFQGQSRTIESVDDYIGTHERGCNPVRFQTLPASSGISI